MYKVIFISGASSGMGKDTALALLKAGHKVYAAARRVEQMADIEEQGGIAIAMDITKGDQVKAAVAQVMEAEGRIDVLWNNAGYGLYGAVEDIPIEDARRQFEVNLFGLALLTQEVLPHMRKKRSGTIINTSSMGGKMYTPMGAWYHATKHALEGWSDSLRLELKAFNINVVILEPGVIKTEFGEVLYEPFLKYSGDTAYAPLANAVANSTQEMYGKPNNISSTKVISDTVEKIVMSPKPKTRYRVGKFAKPMVWMRLFFGDRFFDGLVISTMKRYS